MFAQASKLTWKLLKLALWYHGDVGLGLEKWQVIFLFTFSLIIMLRQIGKKFFYTWPGLFNWIHNNLVVVIVQLTWVHGYRSPFNHTSLLFEFLKKVVVHASHHVVFWMCQVCKVFYELNLLPRQILNFGFVLSRFTLVWNWIELPPDSLTLTFTAKICHQVFKRPWNRGFFLFLTPRYPLHLWLESF